MTVSVCGAAVGVGICVTRATTGAAVVVVDWVGVVMGAGIGVDVVAATPVDPCDPTDEVAVAGPVTAGEVDVAVAGEIEVVTGTPDLPVVSVVLSDGADVVVVLPLPTRVSLCLPVVVVSPVIFGSSVIFFDFPVILVSSVIFDFPVVVDFPVIFGSPAFVGLPVFVGLGVVFGLGVAVGVATGPWLGWEN